MADRKANNIPSSSANLLFSGAPEFNFSLPFLPVSQATGPAVLSGGELIKSSSELLLVASDVSFPLFFSSKVSSLYDK